MSALSYVAAQLWDRLPNSGDDALIREYVIELEQRLGRGYMTRDEAQHLIDRAREEPRPPHVRYCEALAALVEQHHGAP